MKNFRLPQFDILSFTMDCIWIASIAWLLFAVIGSWFASYVDRTLRQNMGQI